MLSGDEARSGVALNDLHHWLETPLGAVVRRWECEQLQAQVADVFGYHAVQLGVPLIDGLSANRMPTRWLAAGPDTGLIARFPLQCDFTALPFDDNCLDLVVMPHTLEWCGEAAACLREVERVLRPEGRLIVTGFNPNSWWGLRQKRLRLWQGLWPGKRADSALFLPEDGEFIAYRRLRDWLALLSFEVEMAQFGVYDPPVKTQIWIDRNAWIARLGKRFWPGWGAVYMVSAVKRVRGMRLVRPARVAPAFGRKPVAAVQRAPRVGQNSDVVKQHIGQGQ